MLACRIGVVCDTPFISHAALSRNSRCLLKSMADLDPPTLIFLIKQLIASSVEPDSSQAAPTDSPLVHHLQSNLTAFKNILSQEKFIKISNIVNDSVLTDEPSNTLQVYLEFVREGLHLVSLLDTRLRVLDKQDQVAQSDSRDPPQALLSVSDLKTVHSLLQFIVSLGIYPYLSPEIDRMLAMRLAHVNSVEKMVHLPSKVRAFLLYRCVEVLVTVCENPVFGAFILSKHLSDIMSALIQICYASGTDRTSSHCDTQTPKTLVTPGDIGPQVLAASSPSDSVSISDITTSQQEWCVGALHKLLSHTYQPLVIKELLSLQGLASRNSSTRGRGKGSSRGSQRREWVQRSCGRLLSERLMDKDGVQNVLKAVYDSGAGGGDDWKKCQAVAMVIASCPAQASSVEEYYSLVCPQVLHLAQESEDFLKVAVATMSVLLTRQGDLAMKYLLGPLVGPLSQLCSGHINALSLSKVTHCILNLHKVVISVEPSSPLLTAILSHSPLFFHVWLAGRDLEHAVPSVQSMKILSRVLGTTDKDTVLTFLSHISGLSPAQSDTVSVPFHSPHPTLSLVYTATGNSLELTAHTLTEEEVSGRQSVEEMERVGGGLVFLLISELKQDSLVGSFFLVCLHHLTTVLSQQTATHSTQATQESSTAPASSSVLLECEHRLPPSQSEAFTHSLVLYVTAALCEEASSTVLEQASLPDLLSCLGTLLSCHASHCEGVEEVMLRRSSADDVLGGPITLSVGCGLLSAILSGAVQVERKHRPLLTQLQPSLVTIATSYPHEELSSLASELHMCIATLGAVWSTEGEERGVAQLAGSKEAVKKSITRQAKKTMECAQSSETSTTTASSPHTVRALPLYQQALEEVRDPLLPVKAHGLLSLSKLIESKDEEALSHTHSLLSLFTEHLQHGDSYVYLAAINGLVSLTTIPDARSSVVSTLCQDYAQLSAPPSHERASQVHTDTGQLRDKHPSVTPVTAAPGSGSGLSVETRIKLGEVLVKVARRCGDVLPHYLDQIAAAIFTNIKDPDPLIRASSLSNLADVCAGIKFSFSRIRNEVLSCVASILESEQEVKVRQAALVVLKLTIKSLSQDVIEVLGGELRELYHLLKRVEGSERDECTRAHAQAVLGELDTVMREWLFPRHGSETLSKKISILDLM